MATTRVAMSRSSVLVILVAATAACASSPPPAPAPPAPRPAEPSTVYQEGLASWYGPGFDGRTTASGEVFDADSLTAAHRRLPFGTIVRVINVDNGREVVVRINDRGPFVDGRVIDVSQAAARLLGMIQAGTARVQLVIEGMDEDRRSPGLLAVLVGERDPFPGLNPATCIAGHSGEQGSPGKRPLPELAMAAV